jgi:hypothetical protein
MGSPTAVIAATFSWDGETMREYRYQPGRTKRAIYAIGDCYYAVGKTKPTDDVGSEWRTHPDQTFAKKAGTVLWYADVSEGE